MPQQPLSPGSHSHVHRAQGLFIARFAHRALMLTAVISAFLPGCVAKDSASPDAEKSLQVQTAVRLLADSIAQDVTRTGPGAWLRYFEATPRFFMASQGNLVFPDINAAGAGVHDFITRTRRIELTWADVRIDPLTPQLAVMGASFREIITDTTGNQMRIGGYFTAVAEETPAGWRLRDAHWSMADHQQ
jgi:hypothetical protein